MQKIEWREVFNRQPAHICLVDLSYPMTNEILDRIFSSLENLLSLAVSLKGSNRLRVFGFSILMGSSVECILTLQQINIKYEIVKQILQETRNIRRSSAPAKDTCTAACLSNAIDESIRQYNDYYRAFADEAKSLLQLTILSSQNGQWMLRNVKSILNNVDLSCFRKVHVIEVMIKSKEQANKLTDIWESEPMEGTEENSPLWYNSDIDTSSCIEATVEFTPIKDDSYQIEQLFKSWLHDFGTDQEHINVVLRDENDRQVVIKCDLQECLLTPEMLPSSSQFLLSVDAGFTQLVTPNRAKTVANKVPVVCLEPVALLKLGGICESVVFGNPLLLHATKCWKFDWDKLEVNNQLFSALNAKLIAKETAMLVRRKPDIYVNANKKNNPESLVQGHYIIMPSEKENCMLIRSAVTKEMILPSMLNYANSESVAAHERSLHSVEECLSKLVMQERYNPWTVSCNLYPQLLTSLSKSKPGRMKP